MKNFKKLLSLFLAVVVAISFINCDGGGDGDDPEPSVNPKLTIEQTKIVVVH